VLAIEGTWDETDWAHPEGKAHTVIRAGWWIDQRQEDGADEEDRGTENPFL
jgi:hypothetical protein